MLVFNYPGEAALLVGVALAASSVSISAQILLELGVLRTQVGFGLLATALVDDVLAVLMLSFVSASMHLTGSLMSQEGGVAIILRAAGYVVAAL
jgi:Kef-type K+ transport system membrane component KefB